MENRFLNCCHDSVLIGSRSECDKFSCQGKHNPVFNVYYHKGNNYYFYCLNKEQLGQCWRCVVEDRDSFCPSKCDQCNICKEMSDVYVELQNSYFLCPKTSVHEVPYQPIMWRVFTSKIDKNSKKFRIEIGKSI